jgi:hypothetical protein
MILLPRHSDRGNSVWYLTMNQIAWQIVYLPRHGGHGNNTLGNTILVWQYRLLQRRCSWQMSLLLRYQSLHVPHFATKTGVASAYISMTMNVATTSYCHAWQWTTMVARNPNTCNAKLATVAIPYCNVTFCNHWQRTWFACNFYLLQPNWAYCNIFSSLHKGLEVSSHTPPQRNRHPRWPNTPSTEQTINRNVPS